MADLPHRVRGRFDWGLPVLLARTLALAVPSLLVAVALFLVAAGRAVPASTAAVQGEGAVSHTLEHNNDGESSLLTLTNSVEVEGNTTRSEGS